MVTVIPGSTSHDRAKNKKIDKVLKKIQDRSVKQQGASLEEAAAALALESLFPYVDLSLFPLKKEDVMLLPETEAKQHQAAVFRSDRGLIYIALAAPEDAAVAALTKFAERQHATPRFYIASRASLEKAWHLYATEDFLNRLHQTRVSLTGEDLAHFEENFGELLDLGEKHDRVATTDMMEIILAGAVKLGSSDIHIEPGEEKTRLRFRIDGELQDIGMLPNNVFHLILSRIKLLGKMKLNIREAAQDGHFEISVEDKRTDVRVSIIPGQDGENINMRLLTGEEAFVDVSKLGMRPSVEKEVQKQAAKPNGLMLNTGPTGSGKTTTLYSLLNSINDASRKIITIEDPIEYQLAGIVQTEVSKNDDYSFAKALRAIVRQDPDILLVGEIRDGETAEIALNAALTGHLVFSTLHTNDAPASVIRLRELGVDSELIASAVNIFIAQRLVRVLCEQCKRAYTPAEKTKAAFLHILEGIPKNVGEEIPTAIGDLYTAVGCAKCNFTGYKGRIGVFEVFPVTDAIKQALTAFDVNEVTIRKEARTGGMLSIIEDGILKVIEGTTTLEELVHHVGVDEALEEFYTEILEAAPQEKDTPEIHKTAQE